MCILFSIWYMRLPCLLRKQMLEKPEGEIKNGQATETDNKTKTIKANTQHNMCCTPLCANKHVHLA